MELFRCENLEKSFDGLRVLSGVTLQIPSPGVVAIIGPNGAGKTTLLNVLTGFVNPDGGRWFLGSRELTRLPAHRIAGHGVARTFQDLRLVRLVSVLDNVMLAYPSDGMDTLWRAVLRVGVARAERSIREGAMRALELVELAGMAAELAGSLSYGQQKLLTLACCFARQTGILLLDEPVAGVHPELAAQILRLLRQIAETGRLIVFIEHDIAAVRQIADRVIVMDEGRVIADGVPGDVLDRPEIMEAYIG